MIVTIATPLHVPAENGEWTSRVTGYETAADGTVTEVFTEYGSVPATPALCSALAAPCAPVAIR